MAEPVQPLSEGEDPTPRGPERPVRPSVQRHAKTLGGEKEGGARRYGCLPRRAPFPANAPGQVFAQPCAPPPAYRIQAKPLEHSGA